jgi:hypothetical protein
VPAVTLHLLLSHMLVSRGTCCHLLKFKLLGRRLKPTTCTPSQSWALAPRDNELACLSRSLMKLSPLLLLSSYEVGLGESWNGTLSRTGRGGKRGVELMAKGKPR